MAGCKLSRALLVSAGGCRRSTALLLTPATRPLGHCQHPIAVPGEGVVPALLDGLDDQGVIVGPKRVLDGRFWIVVGEPPARGASRQGRQILAADGHLVTEPIRQQVMEPEPPPSAVERYEHHVCPCEITDGTCGVGGCEDLVAELGAELVHGSPHQR